MKSLITLLLFSLIGGHSFAQALKTVQANELYVKAMKYYESRNYDSLVSSLEQVVNLRPDHPGIRYNLAAAYALDGRPFDAVKNLGKIADMKLYYAVQQDSDFKSIRSSDLFIPVQKKFEQNIIPVTNSSAAFVLKEKGLLTEGLAFDAATGRFFISSVHKRKIIEYNSIGESGQFNSQNADLLGIFGMKADEKNRILWAAAGAIKFMEGYEDSLKGASFLYKFNLDDGSLLHAYPPPETGGDHLFGDLTINSRGDVYVSDSRDNAIYRMSADGSRLEIFIPSGYFLSLQGIAFSDDDSLLYAADYSQGIFKINTPNGSVNLLENKTSTTLLGIDGLYFYKGKLIATQNGVNPQRILSLKPDDEITKVVNYKILESNNPLFDEPTLGVIDKDNFYFISNSQWGRFDKSGRIFPDEQLDNPRILMINLKSSDDNKE